MRPVLAGEKEGGVGELLRLVGETDEVCGDGVAGPVWMQRDV